MPSENAGLDSGDLALEALKALTPRVETFHSAVATAVEEIRTFVQSRRGASDFRAERALMELGPFAVGRIDAEKFATLMDAAENMSSETEGVLDRAEEILYGFSMGKDFHHVVVGPGEDLRDAVKEALDDVGRCSARRGPWSWPVPAASIPTSTTYSCRASPSGSGTVPNVGSPRPWWWRWRTRTCCRRDSGSFSTVS